MKKGYRLSAPIALYNYRQDRVANFAPGWASNAWNTAKGWGQGALQGVKNAGMGIDSLAQATGSRVGSAIQGAGQRAMSKGLQGNGMVSNALIGAGGQAANIGGRIAEGGRYGKLARRAIGYGVPLAGIGALGAAGVAGYNALRPKDEQGM